MTGYYHAIDTTLLNKKPILAVKDQPADISLDSPAIELMEDFTVTKPLKVSDQLAYGHVKEILFDTHSDHLLVHDQQQQIIGFIPIEDIMGIRSMMRAHEYQQRLHDLSARDLMEPIHSLPALSLVDVRRANLGDIVATFKQCGASYLVVMDEANEKIVGLFSSRYISRVLGMKVESGFQAMSVAEIAQAITGHYSKV